MYLGGQVQELGRYLPEVLYRNRVLVPVVQEQACALNATPLNHLHTLAQSQVSCCNTVLWAAVFQLRNLIFLRRRLCILGSFDGKKPAKSLSRFLQKCQIAMEAVLLSQTSYLETSLIRKIRIALRILNPLNLLC